MKICFPIYTCFSLDLFQIICDRKLPSSKHQTKHSSSVFVYCHHCRRRGLGCFVCSAYLNCCYEKYEHWFPHHIHGISNWVSSLGWYSYSIVKILKNFSSFVSTPPPLIWYSCELCLPHFLCLLLPFQVTLSLNESPLLLCCSNLSYSEIFGHNALFCSYVSMVIHEYNLWKRITNYIQLFGKIIVRLECP
jgi:hypothetical protein